MLQQRSESATPKDLGEDWPKKPVTNLLLKEATTKKQHSVNISYNMGTGHPKDFLVYFLYSGPSMYRHFGRNTHGHFLEPPALCLCTLVVKHSCHHHMPFCQSPLFASFLALQVPLRNLLYLLWARLSKKSVNRISYPGIFPKPAQLNKSRTYHQSWPCHSIWYDVLLMYLPRQEAPRGMVVLSANCIHNVFSNGKRNRLLNWQGKGP
jgi:hypothetical protein